MKKVFAVAAACFCIALAIIVGYRMSAEAMAVVIGVICGVLASIPMSALILVITQRQRRQEEEIRWVQQRNSPPVVVIQGGNTMQRPGWQTLAPPMASVEPRQFSVIGGDQISGEAYYRR